MTVFYELHTRSAFSFLSSGSLPEDIAVRSGELDMPAIGMMDRDTVSGAVRLHFEAKEQGVRAMIGSEITMDDGSLLPLMPLDLTGYQNLCRLITTVKLRHKKGEHFATRRDIEEHSAGLLCFTGGADGFLHHHIKRHQGQEALAWLNYVFEGRLYVELQRHNLPHEEAVNQTLLGLAHKFRLPSQRPWRSPTALNSRWTSSATHFPIIPCRRARRWTRTFANRLRKARSGDIGH
ncbi:MAG: PHP domain-containing protein [Chloracidobacterium sp.]|nr:PHP domain-containing protein [Chloracidobacterium sp.]